MTAEYLVADVFDGLREIPDGSVDLVVTSPPFLALRSYLPADHPDKGKEMGSEPTPAVFIDSLLAVTAELRRVLAPYGSVCVELGDTYSGTGGAGGDWSDSEMTTKARVNGGSDGGPTRRITGDGWPLAKSLSLIPEAFRFALAYGFNPHTGQESPAGKWRIRNVVRWVRPNPPVGALGDKWRPATSELVVATVSGKRFWDDLATRRPVQHPNQSATSAFDENGNRRKQGLNPYHGSMSSGAPLLDWWEIPPGGYNGAHYAVFPPELVEPCVKAMAPVRVCVVCGEPSRRITSNERVLSNGEVATTDFMGGNRDHGLNQKDAVLKGWSHNNRDTIGWSDCGHDSWRAGVVLDPFVGSGTTILVADALGYDAIGIDIDETNKTLWESRRDDRAFTLRRQAELF